MIDTFEVVRVFLIDLPPTIRAFTAKNEDESFTILINARLSNQMQIEAYDHEISHINNGDYDRAVDVNALETIRHAV